MRRDPSEIATSLIHEHGKVAAMQLALKETIKAQNENDNYSLSIWRDVKRILRGFGQPLRTQKRPLPIRSVHR